MEAFNIVEDVGSSLGQCLVGPAVHTLAPEHAEEAFGDGIVAAVADSTHAANQIVAAKKALVIVAGEPLSFIGVQHDRLVPCLALPERHQHGFEHEIPDLV
jgi:hypothetical protein